MVVEGRSNVILPSSNHPRTKKTHIVTPQPEPDALEGENELNSSEGNDAEAANDDTNAIKNKSSLEQFEQESSYRQEKSPTLKNTYISNKMQNMSVRTNKLTVEKKTEESKT